MHAHTHSANIQDKGIVRQRAGVYLESSQMHVQRYIKNIIKIFLPVVDVSKSE
jgi:hypothetical protein